MKIGVITLPLHINYGGFLQNYALQVVLKRMGHEPLTLNQRPKRKSFKEKMNTYYLPNLKTMALRLIGKGNDRIWMHIHNKSFRTKLWKESTFFYDKYMTHTVPLRPDKDFLNICDKYNLAALIVGSDQVWRPRYVENLSVNYLAFADGKRVKKISYAASFGTDQWEYNEHETEKCKGLIKDFALVTVREKAAVSLCKELFGTEAYQVLDPTLLLDKEDYITIIENEEAPKSKGNLFCYVLDETFEKKNFVMSVAQKTGLIPFYVNIGESPAKYSKKFVLSHLERFQNPPIENWLRGFMDAEMVIADSFHAVAFSIIFNKPFWVIGNKSRGMSRFQSILELFNLGDRLLDESELAGAIDYQRPIDWGQINSIRKEWKIKSIELLRKGLS